MGADLKSLACLLGLSIRGVYFCAESNSAWSLLGELHEVQTRNYPKLDAGVATDAGEGQSASKRFSHVPPQSSMYFSLILSACILKINYPL